MKIDPRTEELLEIVRKRVDPEQVDYVLGGALAMAAHGYARHTSVVDLFIVEKDRHKVFRLLRDAGLQISAVMSPFHYMAVLPEHDDLDVRIDLLFPTTEPEMSAIDLPDRKSITQDTSPLNIFSVDLLAIAKFYSDRDEDEADLRAMYNRGIFDTQAVSRLIRREIDEDDADDWDRLIERFGRRRPSRKKPSKHIRCK
jgi:hypothetical protein